LQRAERQSVSNIHSMLKAHAAMMQKWEEVAGAVSPAAQNGNGHK
jgi:hypothetical protein